MSVSSANPNVPAPRPAEAERFRVGAWVVTPATGEIASAGRVARLEPKTMDVLVYLASRPGEVVSRQDIESQVWRGAVVGYDAITKTVIKLRKALGDRSREPRYIATVPKRGYRLIAPVSSVADELSAAGAANAGPTSAPLNRRVRSPQAVAVALLAGAGTAAMLAIGLYLTPTLPPPGPREPSRPWWCCRS